MFSFDSNGLFYMVIQGRALFKNNLFLGDNVSNKCLVPENLTSLKVIKVFQVNLSWNFFG